MADALLKGTKNWVYKLFKFKVIKLTVTISPDLGSIDLIFLSLQVVANRLPFLLNVIEYTISGWQSIVFKILPVPTSHNITYYTNLNKVLRKLKYE